MKYDVKNLLNQNLPLKQYWNTQYNNAQQPQTSDPWKCKLFKVGNYPEFTCLETRKIRDNIMPIPDGFCVHHCGKINDVCKTGKCHLIRSHKSIMNVSCRGENHRRRHFLLCGMEKHISNSEKFWAKLAKKRNWLISSPI